MTIRAVAPDIDILEAEANQAPRPGEDMIILPLPIPVYKALSDAAAKKNMTVAKLLARAITLAIEED